MSSELRFSESQTELTAQVEDATSLRSYQSNSSFPQQDLEPHRSNSLLLRDERDSDATPRASTDGGQDQDAAIMNYQRNAEEQYRPRYGSIGQYTSEEAYLSALRAWVSEKQYFRPGELSGDRDAGLVGFYGKTTMEDYGNRPSLGLRTNARKKEEENRKQRRATADESARHAGEHDNEETDKQRRKSSISDLFLRRRRGP